MIRTVLTFVFATALAAGPCLAQVEQYIRFNATLTYSPVSNPGSASVFLSNSNAIAAYEASTRGTFATALDEQPDLIPLFTSPPEIVSLNVVQAVERNSDELGVTFQTVMRVTSASGLTDTNLVNIDFDPYWYSNPLLLSGYLFDLAEEVPSVFSVVSSFQFDFETPKSVSSGSPPTRTPVTAPTRAPVSPTAAPVRPPTSAPVVAPTPMPFRRPTMAELQQPTRSPVWAPTAAPWTPFPVAPTAPAAQGIEQFIAVNGTLIITGVAFDSTVIFLNDPEKIAAYEALTKQTFETGIANPDPNINLMFTAPPEILSLKLVEVTNPSTDSIVVTFETTMRIYADAVLTEDDFLMAVKFGPYWYSDADRSFAYLFDLQTIFPSMFEEDGSFQIGFAPARAIADPTTPRPTPAPVPSPTPAPVPSPTPAPVPSPTQQPVAPTPAPVMPSTVSPALAPTLGIEQFIILNATIQFTGVDADSVDIFMSEPQLIAAFEALTQQTFEAGIADTQPGHNSMLTIPPEILALKVMKVTSPETDQIAVTFQTTMRLYAETILTDQNFLVNIKFGPYFYSNPDRSFAYVVNIQSVYPNLFVVDEVYFQIDFGVAKSIDGSDLLSTTLTAAPSVAPFTFRNEVETEAPTAAPTAAPVTFAVDTSTRPPSEPNPSTTGEEVLKTDQENSLSSGAFAPMMEVHGIVLLLGAAVFVTLSYY